MSPSSFAPGAAQPTGATEHRHTFECLGGTCTVIVADARRPADAAAAAAMAKRALLEWHRRFTRFDPDSELSRLNRDAHAQVPVSPLMRRVIEAALTAAGDTDGLVDATLGGEIERAGYATHFAGEGIGLGLALSLAPPRAPAGGHPAQRWRQIAVNRRLGAVIRPPGTTIDPGGIAKGVFADELATLLAGFDAYALDCAGDVRIGGCAGLRATSTWPARLTPRRCTPSCCAQGPSPPAVSANAAGGAPTAGRPIISWIRRPGSRRSLASFRRRRWLPRPRRPRLWPRRRC